MTSYHAPGVYILQNNSNSETMYQVASFGLNETHYGTIPNGDSSTFTLPTYTRTNVLSTTSTSGNAYTPPSTEAVRYPIQWITDRHDQVNASYIFDPNFPTTSRLRIYLSGR